MRLKPLLLLTLALCFLSPDTVWAQFSSVRIQVIDVGQGDGILIRTPNQRWILIDAGTNSQIAGALGPEWGVDRLALAVVSHRHFDHHGGMDEILRDLTVERLAAVMEDCPDRTSDDTWRAEVGDDVEIIDQGTSVTINGVLFEILPASPARPSAPTKRAMRPALARY